MNELGYALTLLAVALVGGIVLREYLVWRRRRSEGPPTRRVGFYADSEVGDPRLQVAADTSEALPLVGDAEDPSYQRAVIDAAGEDPLDDDFEEDEYRQAGMSGIEGTGGDAHPLPDAGAPVHGAPLDESALDALRAAAAELDDTPLIPLEANPSTAAPQGDLFTDPRPPAGGGAATGAGTDPGGELIVALHVMHPEGATFPAQAVQSALGEAGLYFGAMRIYHHPGLSGEQDRASVFSVAKAVEPGSFDPRDRSSFATPGLVFFLQLPGEQDGLVTLELMLATAERIARRLDGVVLDQRRALLSAQGVSHLRESVAGFELTRQMRAAREDR